MRGSLKDPRHAVAVGVCCMMAALISWVMGAGSNVVTAFLSGLAGGLGLAMAIVGFVRDARGYN